MRSVERLKSDCEVAVELPTILGEAAIWDGDRQQLYWLDIEDKALFVFDPLTKRNVRHDLGERVGTVVPARDGTLVLALENSVATYDLSSRTLTHRVPLEDELPQNRANDGKCDSAGRLWVGSIAPGHQRGGAALYRIEGDFRVTRVLSGISISNGVAWSLDRRSMYYIDTPTRQIVRFDYDLGSGAISNQTVVVEVPQSYGYPDGMTIDSEGMLWVAHFGGWAVRRWDPTTGTVLATVSLPVKNVTSCAFGDADLGTLYITTARFLNGKRDLAQQPLAGSLFKTRPGVSGIPTACFGA